MPTWLRIVFTEYLLLNRHKNRTTKGLQNLRRRRWLWLYHKIY